jgi:hypothetical protein
MFALLDAVLHRATAGLPPMPLNHQQVLQQAAAEKEKQRALNFGATSESNASVS